MNETIYRSPAVDDRAIWDAWLSMQHFPAVAAADEVGLFAALAAGRNSTEALAERLGLDGRALGILLGLLGGLGLAERREGRWQATLVARSYLDPQGQMYWGNMLKRFREFTPVYERFVAALRRTSVPGHKRASDGWESGKIDAETARNIAGYMHAHSVAASVGAARGVDFGGVRKLLDVGGGSGVFAAAIAQNWPQLRATVLDLDTMCAAAKPYIEAAGCTDRVGE